MALRNQPYLPLYVQDYLTDEKLSMCTWEAQGIYIKLLCLLHKSQPYGSILLKQTDKQSGNVVVNFASKIMKLIPIERDVLQSAIQELIDEGCLIIDGDKLVQKRMVRDNEISEIRSMVGKKGGEKTQYFAKANNEAKYETETITVTESKKRNLFIPPTIEQVKEYCAERKNKVIPEKFIDYYESNGWMVGKNKMRDWKAAVRTWEQNTKYENTSGTGKRNTKRVNDYWNTPGGVPAV